MFGNWLITFTFIKKKIMKSRLLIFTVFLFIFISFGRNVFSQDTVSIAKRYFGLSLQPNFQGLITFAIIEISEKGLVNRTFLSYHDWLLQIIGVQQSEANPEGKNILKDAGIEGPEILDELWKLRYSEPPYDGAPPEKGWAGNERIPTEGQMEMLSQFGIKTISDYFYGKNLLKLLNAMEDPGWVADYQNK